VPSTSVPTIAANVGPERSWPRFALSLATVPPFKTACRSSPVSVQPRAYSMPNAQYRTWKIEAAGTSRPDTLSSDRSARQNSSQDCSVGACFRARLPCAAGREAAPGVAFGVAFGRLVEAPLSPMRKWPTRVHRASAS
jgi:hypothetical protein